MSALDRARRKAYWRLIPLVFLSYVIAYVDRTNVSIAGLTMSKDLGFDNSVFGFGMGVFFLGYFLLEIPGTLLVERWSARKWISRIMVSWGIMAACTAWVETPMQFYSVRFLLGLAEAGFFPGVIVYLTHWFTSRDRARALSYFFIAGPFAQILSPKISNLMLAIGTDAAHPKVMGMAGWQWVFIVWGIPAVVLGVIVFFAMTDRPAEAKWLTTEEREALEAELKRDREQHSTGKHMSVLDALRHPAVLLLAAAYFFIVTANYGVELFLPKILQTWYQLDLDAVTWLVMIPSGVMLAEMLFVAWNSDRTSERWLHASLPMFVGAVALALTPWSNGSLWLTVLLCSLTMGGARGYLPAFWALPNLFLTGGAAAGSIGLINSFGNLGGWLGPSLLGKVQVVTGSFEGGLYVLAGSMVLSGVILMGLRAYLRARVQ